MNPVAQVSGDRRSARRRRNTDAVLDAVHALFLDGRQDPTVEEVAARSGVSLRSVYRYFPDRDQLLRAALERRLGVAEPLFHIERVGEGSLDERIERFAEHRVAVYEEIAPTARAALRAAASAPVIAEVVQRRRRQLTEQTRRHFAPELDALPEEHANDLLAALDMLCQFESVEALRVGRRPRPGTAWLDRSGRGPHDPADRGQVGIRLRPMF